MNRLNTPSDRLPPLIFNAHLRVSQVSSITDLNFIIHYFTKKRKLYGLRILAVEGGNRYKRNYDCPPQQLHDYVLGTHSLPKCDNTISLFVIK